MRSSSFLWDLLILSQKIALLSIKAYQSHANTKNTNTIFLLSTQWVLTIKTYYHLPGMKKYTLGSPPGKESVYPGLHPEVNFLYIGCEVQLTKK